jgi:tetratricopeptide (TPR) repeat protein
MRGCTEIIAGAGFSTEQTALAFRNRGRARLEAGSNEQAVSDLTQAIERNASDAITFLARGQARLSLADTTGAIADMTQSLRLAPSSTPALITRAHAYLVNGQTELSIGDLDAAIAINPKSASAFNHRGLAHRRAGDLAKAIADYTTALTINPTYALAYNNRGYAHEAKGSKAEAIADFATALTLDQSLVGAAAGLKRLGATDPMTATNAALVSAGQALVEANCSRCHATGWKDSSPNPRAPEFRRMHQRHPVLALREPLSRAIAAPHDEMPTFYLAETDVDKIIAYITSLSVLPAK